VTEQALALVLPRKMLSTLIMCKSCINHSKDTFRVVCNGNSKNCKCLY